MLLCLAARVALLQGLVKPVRVVGASMAEALRGNHFELTCRDCGFPCRFDADESPRDERVVCPNCGYVHHGFGGARADRGDRVLIDRLAYFLTAPQRWDLVAFQMPDDERLLAVKRVVGLPGERVEIRAGDIYVDGQIQRKSLAQLRSLAILVHDSDFAAPADRALPPRWAAETVPSGWRQEHGAFVCEPSTGGHDWLTYRHWRCFSSPLPRTDEYPILDNYGYNQDESRQLQRVTDLLLICRICVVSGTGSVALRADDGRDRFEVTLDPGARRGRLYRNGRGVLTAALPPMAYASGVNIELALCDQRISLAIDRQTVLEHDYTPSAEDFHPTAHPLSIGARALGISVRRLLVFRDISYLDSVGLPRDWVSPRALAADQFFVLGDNSPRSRDSRQDPRGGVSRQRFLGKVLTGR
ncbi:MAG: signal peptidase I [Planctomycetota bacterium]|nr:signal peptidase I [Planctomycetota bacterium]